MLFVALRCGRRGRSCSAHNWRHRSARLCGIFVSVVAPLLWQTSMWWNHFECDACFECCALFRRAVRNDSSKLAFLCDSFFIFTLIIKSSKKKIWIFSLLFLRVHYTHQMMTAVVPSTHLRNISCTQSTIQASTTMMCLWYGLGMSLCCTLTVIYRQHICQRLRCP